MTATEIYQEAVRRGLRLEPRGNKLVVIPGDRVPPDFADTLRQHKGELLDLLEAQSSRLTPDCAAWLHVAKQVLAGESLTIGLRSIPHPLCSRALARLCLNE
jgi:hypothetical protein